jgi:hypothetical protein
MRTSFTPHVRTPTTVAELQAMRERAWRQQGVVVLQPDEIGDPWLRQALVNEAERRYGRQRESGR